MTILPIFSLLIRLDAYVRPIVSARRAPVLVAIALIEAGMDPLDAVHLIRGCRRGAINTKQLSFLESYRRRSKRDGCAVS